MIEIKNAIRMIQSNGALPVYYLKGNDQFLHNFFIEKLCNSIFAENNIVKSLLTPNEMSGKEIIEQILFSDLFNTQKLFILRDPQQLKGKAVMIRTYQIERLTCGVMKTLNARHPSLLKRMNAQLMRGSRGWQGQVIDAYMMISLRVML